MPSILVTLPTCQLFKSWLKEEALLNIFRILVTLLTSQWSIFVFKEEASSNILDISVTIDRSGASVALISRLIQSEKALFIECQTLVPHCSMDSIFSLSPVLGKEIWGKSPRMATV